jgi:site-specific DNA-methyltransferase (adenine-specific)/site-specific DNA-methyltransferase (cytosine-N4-specific)
VNATDVKYVTADARDIPLPDNCVDLALWSPPYFAARIYGDSDSEIGRPSPIADYIKSLVDAANESMRLVRPTGSLFINVQDRYINRTRVRRSAHQPGLHGKASRAEFSDSWADAAKRGEVIMPNRVGVRERSLALIPERLALALYAEGYWIKAHNIWCKPFGVPDHEARDRTVIRHESVLHVAAGPHCDAYFDGGSRRSTLTINPSSGEAGHPAPWPEELCEWIISGWSKPGDVVLDAFGGSGTTARVAERLGRGAYSVDIYDWHGSPYPKVND